MRAKQWNHLSINLHRCLYTHTKMPSNINTDVTLDNTNMHRVQINKGGTHTLTHPCLSFSGITETHALLHSNAHIRTNAKTQTGTQTEPLVGVNGGEVLGRRGESSLSWDVSVSWGVCMYVFVLCVCNGRGNMLHYTHLTHKQGEWQAGVGDGGRGECKGNATPPPLFYKYWNPAIKTQTTTAKSTSPSHTYTEHPQSDHAN